MSLPLQPLPLPASIELESPAVLRQLARSHRHLADKYLDTLHIAGFVKKTKLGRTNFYINEPLFTLLGR